MHTDGCMSAWKHFNSPSESPCNSSYTFDYIHGKKPHTHAPNIGLMAFDLMRENMDHTFNPLVSPRRIFGPSAAATAILTLSACAFSPPPSLVQGPTHVAAPAQYAQVEQMHNGSIFQPHNNQAWLFSDQYKPRRVGDTLKIEISEALTSSNNQSTETSRDNKVASKGPGTGDDSLPGLLRGILNMDASASGSDSFKGGGKHENSSALKGKMGASVINVLPNGNLVVAGERRISHNGNISTLRFSGVVNPKDIQPGGVVASTDVVNARFEHAGQGDVSDANSRNWMQRVLTQSLAVW